MLKGSPFTFGSGMSSSAEEKKIVSLTKKIKQMETEMQKNNDVLKFCLKEILLRDKKIRTLELLILTRDIPCKVKDEFCSD